MGINVRVALRWVALIAGAFVAVGCKQGEPTKAVSPAPASAAKQEPQVPFKGIASGAGLNDVAKSGERVPSVEFTVPKTVAVGKSDDINFVFQAATIEPRNPESVRLVLLVRLSNRSPYPANFWDASFRLVTHSATIAASGGLNAVVDGRSDSMLEKVQFVVPLSSTPRALRIEHGGESVELPLRFL